MAERRARLARRHRLEPGSRAATPGQVADSLVALHATDAASVYLSTWARMAEPALEAVEGALYDARSMVRMLGMRRTVFVVPAGLVDVVQAACTDAIARQQRQLLLRMLAEAGVAADPAPWLDGVEAATLAELDGRGEALASELSAAIPALRVQMRLAVGKRYEGVVGLSTRMLLVLAAEGKVVRGRPRGSWISTQYRWALLRTWLGRDLLVLPAADAQAELARHYLGAFGPATEADLQWWAGWTAAQTRHALRSIGAVSVEIDGLAGHVLADDLEPEAPVAPSATLLPALDPSVMGWKLRDWFLGGHAERLFDRSGNAGPTVWWDGRVVGGWAIRGGGEVVHELFEDTGREAEGAIAAEAARMSSVVAGTRVVPRFRTPLEKQLAGP